MNFDTAFNAKGLVVPNFEVAVPTNWGKVLYINWTLERAGDESDFAYPVEMIVFFNSEFQFALTFHNLISLSAPDERIYLLPTGNDARKNFFGITVFYETVGSLGKEIQEMYRAIPRWREQIYVVID